MARYELESDIGNIASSSKSGKAPGHLCFEWSLLHFVLGLVNAVKQDVLRYCKENGVVLKGHAVQKFSWMYSTLESRAKQGDPEVLGYYADWGLDPAKPLKAQYKETQAEFRRRMDAEKAAEQALLDAAKSPTPPKGKRVVGADAE